MKIMHILSWVAGFIVLALLLRSLRIISFYDPREIKINKHEVPNVFGGETKLSCVPGPTKDANYYTMTDSKGLCGLGEYVDDIGHHYQIQDGIGGSLLQD